MKKEIDGRGHLARARRKHAQVMYEVSEHFRSCEECKRGTCAKGRGLLDLRSFRAGYRYGVEHEIRLEQKRQRRRAA